MQSPEARFCLERGPRRHRLSHRHRRILEKQPLRPPAVSPDCFHGNPSFSTILPRGRAVLFGKAAQRRLGRIVGHLLIDPSGMPKEMAARSMPKPG